jgi:hypothetical protein
MVTNIQKWILDSQVDTKLRNLVSQLDTEKKM